MKIKASINKKGNITGYSILYKEVTIFFHVDISYNSIKELHSLYFELSNFNKNNLEEFDYKFSNDIIREFDDYIIKQKEYQKKIIKEQEEREKENETNKNKYINEILQSLKIKENSINSFLLLNDYDVNFYLKNYNLNSNIAKEMIESFEKKGGRFDEIHKSIVVLSKNEIVNLLKMDYECGDCDNFCNLFFL